MLLESMTVTTTPEQSKIAITDDDNDGTTSSSRNKNGMRIVLLFLFAAFLFPLLVLLLTGVISLEDLVLPQRHPGALRSSSSASIQQETTYVASTVPLLPISSPLLPSSSLPPLTTYVSPDNATIIGNPDSLLNLAVIGFAKCGTSTLKRTLDLHPQIAMLKREKQHMGDAPEQFVKKVYDTRLEVQQRQDEEQTSSSLPLLVGYKNPNDIRRLDTSMSHIAQTFPSARLIVTVRHPVTWFKSLWDYSVSHLGEKTSFLKSLDLMGGSHQVASGVQTARAEWHVVLALLGKTGILDNGNNAASSAAELELLQDFFQTDEYKPQSQRKIPNPMFILEMTQMNDTNETRAQSLRLDMSNFLGLESPLPPFLHSNSMQEERQELKEWQAQAAANNARQPKQRRHDFGTEADIDICATEFDAVRKELVRVGTAAAQWIGKYFIMADDVYVSSPQYFRERLQTWTVDPCTEP